MTFSETELREIERDRRLQDEIARMHEEFDSDRMTLNYQPEA